MIVKTVMKHIIVLDVTKEPSFSLNTPQKTLKENTQSFVILSLKTFRNVHNMKICPYETTVNPGLAYYIHTTPFKVEKGRAKFC